MENSVSLAAMEAELKPKVLEIFDTHRRRVQEAAQAAGAECRKPAEQRESCRRARSAAPRSCAKTSSCHVKSLSLNNNRIEALVEQLYDINKRLIGL